MTNAGNLSGSINTMAGFDNYNELDLENELEALLSEDVLWEDERITPRKAQHVPPRQVNPQYMQPYEGVRKMELAAA